MRTVGLKVLKNKLSEYVRAAADGETVLITDRDRVVAEIGSPRLGADAPGTTDAERQWAELIRQGVVRPARISPNTPMPERQPGIMTLEEILRDLDDARSDR